jgi:hypothetical protein
MNTGKTLFAQIMDFALEYLRPDSSRRIRFSEPDSSDILPRCCWIYAAGRRRCLTPAAMCSGAQSKCGRRAIEHPFRRKLIETEGSVQRTLVET